jgi:hypothetical protein
MKIITVKISDESCPSEYNFKRLNDTYNEPFALLRIVLSVSF